MIPLKGYGVCFFKICGPFVIVCAIKFQHSLYDIYEPEFGICSLMFENEDIVPLNLRITLIGKGYFNLLNIEPQQHKELYMDAFTAINSVTYGFLQNRNFKLNEFIVAFKNFIQKSAGKNITHELVTLPLLAAWAGNVVLAEELLEWTIEQSKVVYGNFAGYGGQEGWVATVKELIGNPTKLQAQVQQAIVVHGLSDLPSSTLE